MMSAAESIPIVRMAVTAIAMPMNQTTYPATDMMTSKVELLRLMPGVPSDRLPRAGE